MDGRSTRGGEHVLDHADDALLSVARQLTDFLENLARLSDRAATLSRRARFVEQLFHRNPEHLRHLVELIDSEQQGSALKIKVDAVELP